MTSRRLHLSGLRATRRPCEPAGRAAARVLRPGRAQRADRPPGAAAPREGGDSTMADEAYRAVFLRVHPTGKMVLSLTTEPDGKEAQYAQLVADELGVPPLDVKVVPVDTDRFGVGHGFNTSPSEGTLGGDRQRRGEDPRQGAAARGHGSGSPAGDARVVERRVGRRRRSRPDPGEDGRGSRPVRTRHRRPAAGRRGRARRADRLHAGSQLDGRAASIETSTSSTTFNAPNSVE